MTNNIWNGSIGNFALGSNWSTGKVKGDDEIDAGDATLGLAAPKTVTSLLLGTAGRLTVKGVLTSGAVANHGTIFDWGNFDVASAAFTNTGLLEIGRSVAISDDDVVTSGKSGELKVASIYNTGVVDLQGLSQGSTPSAVLKVMGAASFGAAGVISGKVELSKSAEIKFASGSFTTIAANGTLSLAGPDAVMTTTGGAFSNTTLTTLATNLGTLDLSGGSSIAAAGAFANSGTIDLEKGDESLATSLSIGGALTNEQGGEITLGGDKKLAGFDKLTITGALNNSGDLNLGSSTLHDAVTVTAASLVNASTGYISLVTALPTSSTATLDVASAAGFGTAGVLTGSVYLQGNATLEFASGQIGTIAEFGSLTLDGANALVADATALTSNSALNLSLVKGYFTIENGASETSTGALTVKDALYVGSGSNDIGGSSLSVAGALTNDGYVSIGATNLLANDTVTVASLVNDDTLDLTGTAGAGEAILSDAAAAGLGTAGKVTGTVDLVGNASLEFASGQITTITNDADLELNGDDAFVSDASTLGANSALTGLDVVEGTLELDNGASVTTTGALTVSGYLYMDDFDKAKGGSSLTVGGALTNEGNAYVGGDDILTNDTLTVASLNNTDGELILEGDPGKGEAIVNVGTAAEMGTAGTITGIVALLGNSTLEFKSGVFDTVAGTLELEGNDAFVADAAALGSNSALNLMEVSGTVDLDNGATETSTGNLTVSDFGSVGLDESKINGVTALGGSSLTVDGALTINYLAHLNVGNNDITSDDTVTAASLTLASYGVIDLAGGLLKGEGEALLTVATAADFGTLGTLSGSVELSGDATLEFASGQITTIALDASLDLNGDDAFVADKATLGANSALTGLTTVTGSLDLENGASLTTTGALTVTGSVEIDAYYSYGVPDTGGSSLTIGGALTNSGYVEIGGDDILSSDTVTATSLINTGTIDLTGDPGKGEALLNVASPVDFEAATGTDDTVTGTVDLTGNATLEFASGEVTTIADGADLVLDGDDAFVADKSTLGANSALTGLATVDGEFALDNGATVTTTGALTVADTGDLYLDEATLKGGSSLTVGGALANDGYIYIGSANLGANDTVKVASVNNATGFLELDGDPGFGQAILDVTGVAGFGTAATVVGDVELMGNSTVEFASGPITTIAAGAYLELVGDDAFIADSATLGANSALAGLTTVTGELDLDSGASITTTGPLSVTGDVYVDDYDTIGGTTLTVDGALTNSGDVYIGDYDLVADDKVTVASLSNTGYLQVEGNPGKGKSILTVNSAAGFGTASTVTGYVYLSGASEILFSSGSITTIAAGATLSLDGDDSFIGAANAELALATIDAGGEFSLADGASVTLAGPVSNAGELYLDSEFFGDGKGGTTLTVTGTLTNSGDLYLGNLEQTADDTLAVTTLDNTGEIIGYGSAKSTENITGAVTNSGGVYVESGDLKFGGAVTGTGYFEFDNFSNASTVELDGAVAAGQTIYFDAGSSYGQTLVLGDTAGGAFAAKIADFDAPTVGIQEIDVKNFVATTETYAGDVLTLHNAASTVALTFTTPVTSADFTFSTTATDTIIKNA